MLTYLAIFLVISLRIQVFFFALAILQKTDKYTDLTYGLTFIVLSISALSWTSDIYLPQIIVAAAVVIWALRLIIYLFSRIRKIKKDKRFDDIRGNFWAFGGFWLFQGFSVWLIMLSSLTFIISSEVEKASLFSWTGIVVWLAGLIIETIADIQKYRFKSNPDNKGKWIESGLWRYSRHPNYFGEILCWWGLWIFSVFNWGGWWTVISPLHITFILVFVSGIPILESRYEEKYGENEKYQDYKERTSILVPWFVSE